MSDIKSILIKNDDKENCRIATVTVFSDRAEVNRRVCLKNVEQKATYSITVTGLSSYLDPDSVRVVGKGKMTLHEVQVENNFLSPRELKDLEDSTKTKEKTEQDNKVNELRKKLKVNKRLGKTIEDKIRRLQKEQDFLEAYLKSRSGQKNSTVSKKRYLTKGAIAQHDNDSDNTNVEGNDISIAIDEMAAALDFYQSRGEICTTKLREAQELQSENDETIKSLEKQIKVISGQGLYSNQTKESKNVTMIIECEEKADAVSLDLFYMVKRASWTPSYDLRVNSEDNSMQVTYFGEVKQTTGEDWNDVKVFLSTASPSTGGKPPTVSTQYVDFCSKRVYNNYRSEKFSKRKKKPMQMMIQQQSNIAYQSNTIQSNAIQMPGSSLFEDEDFGNEGFLAEEEEEMGSSSASVSSAGGFTTTFAIARETTVESDNKRHKVTIGVIPMKTKAFWFVAPAVTENVYYEARALNTSTYPMLKSSSARCFFNGAYTCQTEMPDVSPGEVFTTFLGVDAGVKVKCKKQVKKGSKYSGVFSASKTSTEYRYMANIKNTKKLPVYLKIVHQLPVSKNEKINVELMEPSSPSVVEVSTYSEIAKEISASKADDWQKVRIRKDKQMSKIYTLIQLNPGLATEVKFSYNIDYPSNGKDISVYN